MLGKKKFKTIGQLRNDPWINIILYILIANILVWNEPTTFYQQHYPVYFGERNKYVLMQVLVEFVPRA